MVINLDLPNVAEDYVHRIGRTGRAELSGEALSLVSADEIEYLYDIERLIQNHIEREYESGFEPNHELPYSKPILPIKAKRPKKNKVKSQGQQQVDANNNRAKEGGNSKPAPRRKTQQNPGKNSKPAAKSQTSNKPHADSRRSKNTGSSSQSKSQSPWQKVTKKANY